MKIKVREITQGCCPIKTEQGDWIDLKTARDVELNTNEFKLIPLGVAIELPEGYEAHIIPRSSTFLKTKALQANSYGLIDNAYCGDHDEWHFPALATEHVKIPRGTRICQFRIVEKQPEIEFEVVETLGNEDRGGFGSTGR